MVLASNEWLNNSGDEQKSPSGITTSSVSSSNNEAKTTTTIQSKKNTKNPEDLGNRTDFMPTNEKTSCCGIGLDSTTTDDIKESNFGSVAGAGTGTLTNFIPAIKQKSLEKLFKDMATNNSALATSNSGYSSNNDDTSTQNDLETSRTTVPNVNIESTDAELELELENNNRTYASFIDDEIVSGIENESTDSNTNTLNSDITVKNSTISTSSKVADILNAQSTLRKIELERENEPEPAFLNTLSSTGGNVANANIAQTIVMNNANANANAISSSNKQLNSVIFGMETARTSVLMSNNGSNSNNARIKNVNNVNNELLGNVAVSSGDAKIVLICEKNSHPFETRTISLTPNIECKVGRLIAKCKPSESNAIFDCKVLSRNHAVLWYSDDGRFWVKDTNSSNGTFINDNKLGKDAAELHYGNIVKFGVDVVENSRKEVHGCIIACVKLYLPDGREAISIDSSSHRSQFSGESRISFDDLHRLNVYMQETSQREKALKSKLYNIQNLLDMTRKNSSTCWKAMISEDQLLHRINSLEKKIQILEKNMPESALKNEIMKLIDDRSAYQHSAKEALRSVYLERCEAMQKLAKLESDFATSENECKILRDQISATEEALQDVNDRVRLLETEYNDYRTEAERQQLEAKTVLEQRITELTEKMQLREEECVTLQLKIAELTQKTNSSGGIKSFASMGAADDEKLQNQAIENLDAVIADMDIGDDDDDDDDDDDNVDDENYVDKNSETTAHENRLKSSDVYDFNCSSDSVRNDKQSKRKKTAAKNNNTDSKNVVGEATILKWLQNSDLNKKEGSLDIFKAICNSESDSSDEHDTISPIGAGAVELFMERNKKLKTKLQSVQSYLLQLDNEDRSNKAEDKEHNDRNDRNECNEHDDKVVKETCEKMENYEKEESKIDNKFDEKSNGQLSKDDKISLDLIKTTICLLNEVAEDMFDNFKQLQTVKVAKLKSLNDTATATVTQFQKVNSALTNISAPLPEINEVDDELSNEHDSEDEEEDDVNVNANSNSNANDIEQSELVQTKSLSKQTTIVSKAVEEHEHVDVAIYESQIKELQQKLEEQEQNAQHTLEILQIECSTYKEKIAEALQLNEMLRAERALSEAADVAEVVEAAVVAAVDAPAIPDDVGGDGASSDSGVSSIDRASETPRSTMEASANTTISGSISEAETDATNEAVFDEQMREELENINSTAVQREEELIAYKETLEQTQKENIKLRDEILEAKQKLGGRHSNAALMRMAIPLGVVFVGFLAYVVMTYF